MKSEQPFRAIREYACSCFPCKAHCADRDNGHVVETPALDRRPTRACPTTTRRRGSVTGGVTRFVKPHLEQAGRLVVAELADKVAQSARGGTAR